MVKVKTAAPAFSRRRARLGGGSGFGRSGNQTSRGGHRRGAEVEPQLLVESVGVGVAGVGAGNDLGGHRSSGEGELGARVCGEVREVHGWTQRNVVSALDTVSWPEDGREHVGDEIRGGACG